MNRQLRLGILSIGLVLIAWEALVSFGFVDVLVLSSPSRVGLAAIALLGNEGFYHDLRTSGTEFFVGFFAAVVLGVSLGLPMGWYTRLRYMVSPAVSAAYTAPRVAVLPMVVLWFGFGGATTTIMVFLGAFFVILLSVILAAASVDENLLRAARAYCARERHIFRSVLVPAAFPSIITGLRLAIAPGIAGVVIGEMYGASSGLGHFVHVTASTLQMDKMFVALILLASFGLVLNLALTRVETRLAGWRPEHRPS